MKLAVFNLININIWHICVKLPKSSMKKIIIVKHCAFEIILKNFRDSFSFELIVFFSKWIFKMIDNKNVIKVTQLVHSFINWVLMQKKFLFFFYYISFILAICETIFYIFLSLIQVLYADFRKIYKLINKGKK